MKKLFVVLMVCMTVNLFAQEEKTSKINVSGQGKTLEDARQNALRSAIEQAFGAFISSKTELLNDNLVKDEIVSISNGNIQKYTILSEVEIPNVGYATTLEAIVSINQLTKFCESKGIQVEFAGSLFGANMKQQKLNEEAETKAIINLCETSKVILKKALDFEVAPSEPKNVGEDKFEIGYNISIKPNANYPKLMKYFEITLKGISMSETEKGNYKKVNKEYFTISISDSFDVYQREIINERKFELRNRNSIRALLNFLEYSCEYAYNFRVQTNVDSIFPWSEIKWKVKKDDFEVGKIHYYYEAKGNIERDFPSLYSIEIYDDVDFKSNSVAYKRLISEFDPNHVFPFFTLDSINPLTFLKNPENYYSFNMSEYAEQCQKIDYKYRDSCNCIPPDSIQRFKNLYPGLIYSHERIGLDFSYETINSPQNKQFSIIQRMPIQQFTVKKAYTVSEIEKISKVSIVNLNNQP